jgi:hypothetical protein
LTTNFPSAARHPALFMVAGLAPWAAGIQTFQENNTSNAKKLNAEFLQVLRVLDAMVTSQAGFQN